MFSVLFAGLALSKPTKGIISLERERVKFLRIHFTLPMNNVSPKSKSKYRFPPGVNCELELLPSIVISNNVGVKCTRTVCQYPSDIVDSLISSAAPFPLSTISLKC